VEKEAARQSRHSQGTGSLLAVSSSIPPANIWLDNGNAFSLQSRPKSLFDQPKEHNSV
jgi:hypothetical protein